MLTARSFSEIPLLKAGAEYPSRPVRVRLCPTLTSAQGSLTGDDLDSGGIIRKSSNDPIPCRHAPKVQHPGYFPFHLQRTYQAQKPIPPIPTVTVKCPADALKGSNSEALPAPSRECFLESRIARRALLD